ncbi:MAG: helix-turn-helix transcriptional regulator [Lachnospiraceae bacterium]|nr:helix-turn-helix transcriptional regulator [Lachnospiraceae bacterium]
MVKGRDTFEHIGKADTTGGASGEGTYKIKQKLTDTEFRIAQLAAMRMTNKEIADELFLAEGTVRNKLSNVFVKLGIEGDTRNKRLKLEKFFKE